MTDFLDRLDQACAANESLVCVGLDVDPARMPEDDVFAFNRAIIDATSDLVCAYKPNLGFYEALGLAGLSALQQTVEYIRRVSPQAIVIGDAKRGDAQPSSRFYARAMFEVWGFDAVTVNADDAALRGNRLRLLSHIRATLHKVADFGEVEG